MGAMLQLGKTPDLLQHGKAPGLHHEGRRGIPLHVQPRLLQCCFGTPASEVPSTELVKRGETQNDSIQRAVSNAV